MDDPHADGSQLGEILVSAEDLQRRVHELGAEISRDYAGRDLLLVCVLKGAVLFLSDLMRAIDVSVAPTRSAMTPVNSPWCALV